VYTSQSQKTFFFGESKKESCNADLVQEKRLSRDSLTSFRELAFHVAFLFTQINFYLRWTIRVHVAHYILV